MSNQSRVVHTSSGGKVEPHSHAVSVPAVAELGILESRTRKIPIYEGRGLEAPMVGSTIHKRGSQGRY
jgi:hypothetical protein